MLRDANGKKVSNMRREKFVIIPLGKQFMAAATRNII